MNGRKDAVNSEGGKENGTKAAVAGCLQSPLPFTLGARYTVKITKFEMNL